MQTHIYPAGTILMLETGSYSDFGYEGGFVTLAELNLHEAIEVFKDEHKPTDKWDRPEPSNFCAWLVSTQRCAPLNYQTAHIGEYGSLEL
jgi:hypothetical protein